MRDAAAGRLGDGRRNVITSEERPVSAFTDYSLQTLTCPLRQPVCINAVGHHAAPANDSARRIPMATTAASEDHPDTCEYALRKS